MGKAHATRCCNGNLSLPPSGGGRLGWGWLCGLRRNQIRAAHRATLSPTLSRQTGEGAGCTSWHRFLSTRPFQTTPCRISNLVPSPVRRGWGWLPSFRQNQTGAAAHRATLSPALSRRMGEGAGCKSQHKFLPNYRHSRAGGNPLLNLSNCFSNISFLGLPIDSRRSLSSRRRGRE